MKSKTSMSKSEELGGQVEVKTAAKKGGKKS
jgi:hypothetical protein